MSPRFPTLPTGQTIGSYQTYEQAQVAIDQLIKHEGFSVQSISIVGSDLRSVERVTGRMNIGRAALGGLLSGIMIAMFVSLMWVMLMPGANLASLLGIFLLAVAFGVIWSLITFAITPNKREFTSVMQLTAGRFDLVVPHDLAGQALSILRGTAHQPAYAGASAQPGRFGQDAAPGQAGHVGFGQGGSGQSQPSGERQPGQLGHPGQPVQPGQDAPAQPPTPPKTYGEMQDELRRKQQQQQQSPQQSE